jgi:hypothetical protein
MIIRIHSYGLVQFMHFIFNHVITFIHLSLIFVVLVLKLTLRTPFVNYFLFNFWFIVFQDYVCGIFYMYIFFLNIFGIFFHFASLCVLGYFVNLWRKLVHLFCFSFVTLRFLKT